MEAPWRKFPPNALKFWSLVAMIELEVYLVIIGEIVRGDVICKENQAAIFVCAIL